MRIFFLVVLIYSLMFAKDVKMPTGSLKIDGSLVDMIYKDSLLYCATDAGSVEVFDYATKKLLKKIELGKITDFAGDAMDSKVYSVDEVSGKILILSQDEKGFRRLDIYQNSKLRSLFNYKDELTIAKAKFLDEDNIIMALLSNELISYNIKSSKINWKKQVSMAKFSNFVLNEKKSEIVIADESGVLKILNTKDGSLDKYKANKNLDNVFDVDYKNGTIVTAGQDRRMVIYQPKLLSSFVVPSEFLIYSVGLSPSAKLVVYSSDEQNNAILYDVPNKKVLATYGGNPMTIAKILFVSESEFLIGSDSKILNIYNIK